jgi:hypothetical protein
LQYESPAKLWIFGRFGRKMEEIVKLQLPAHIALYPCIRPLNAKEIQLFAYQTNTEGLLNSDFWKIFGRFLRVATACA